MNQKPIHATATEEVDHEEWLLELIEKHTQATWRTNASLSIEYTDQPKRLDNMSLITQVRIDLLDTLKKELIARMNKQLSKTTQHLRGNA